MIRIERTNPVNGDFLDLVKLLDQELLEVNGEDHVFFSQFNKLDSIKHVVVAYDDGNPVACGAMKEYDSLTMEVKRMYTKPAARGKKIAALVLTELENWAAELGLEKCVLETGTRLPSAIKLYERHGYRRIANYGQYADSVNSVCFERDLTK